MLFRQDILQGIADGRVTLAFRRWRKAPPTDGATLRSPVGVLSLDRVTIVDEGDITADEVARTGLSPDDLRASLAGDGTLLRIELRVVGEDPRITVDDDVPASDRRSPWHRGARAGADGGHGTPDVQAARTPTEGPRAHGEPRGRLPSLGTRARRALAPCVLTP
jgi:hypothetical protein